MRRRSEDASAKTIIGTRISRSFPTHHLDGFVANIPKNCRHIFPSHLDLQLDALKAISCDRIFIDKVSGAKSARPELDRMLDFLRNGQDTVVIWRLDRLGRSLEHLVELVGRFHSAEIGLRSLNEEIDTSSAQGRLTFHLFAALAQFERDLISERTIAGLEAARARGRKGGRPAVMDSNKLAVAQSMYAAKKHTLQEIADTIGVSRTTVYRYLTEPALLKKTAA